MTCELPPRAAPVLAARRTQTAATASRAKSLLRLTYRDAVGTGLTERHRQTQRALFKVEGV